VAGVSGLGAHSTGQRALHDNKGWAPSLLCARNCYTRYASGRSLPHGGHGSSERGRSVHWLLVPAARRL
jgi:hypothetical protein